MRRIQFQAGEFYHLYNRGTEKRRIFYDSADYVRFIHYLYHFNDSGKTSDIFHRVDNLSDISDCYVGGPTSYIKKPRKALVDIICFCLMSNHFHLLVQEKIEGGISKFMQKLGTGYTMYFNEKYERSGVLFQGKFKAVHVTDDSQLVHLTRYIHLNPVEIIRPKWKELGIKEPKKAFKFLEKYRWSSYLDYIRIKNFPSVINKSFIAENYFDNHDDYKKFVREWLIDDVEKIKTLIIDLT